MGLNLEEPEAHPLFPVDETSDDDEIKPVTLIHIARKENGKLLFAPRARQAAELQSLEQIHSEFGGGEYTLIGYNNGRISTRRSVNLSGKSKPLYDEGVVDPIPVAQTTTPVIDPMAAMMGGSGGGFMPLIMLMMQQQQQAADRQMQMFLAMMENTRSSSAEDKAAARAEMQSNVERERINSERMMAMMQTAMQSKGGGGSGEDFTRGVEFMRSFATQQIETLRQTAGNGGDTDWGSILETLGQVMQGVGMLKGVAGPLPEGIPAAVSEAAQ